MPLSAPNWHVKRPKTCHYQAVQTSSIQMQQQKLALAQSMTKLISSKIFIGACFSLLMMSLLYQILINSKDQLSAFIAVLPASTVITMAWFTAVRVVFTKSENVWFKRQFTEKLQKSGIRIFYVWCIFSLHWFFGGWADSWVGYWYGLFSNKYFNNLFLDQISDSQ